MKKFCSILFLFLCVYLNLFSAIKEKPGLSRGFVIEGGVGKYNQISVNIINNIATDESSLDSFTQGIPFNLSLTQNPSIAFTNIMGGGRLIGTWSVATNYSNVTFEISATDLVCDADPNATIPYYIVFHIKYASYKPDGAYETDNHEDIVVKSSSNNTSVFYSIDNHRGEDPFPVVSVDQDIRVYLAEGIDPSDKRYPYGYYESNVTITVSGD